MDLGGESNVRLMLVQRHWRRTNISLTFGERLGVSAFAFHFIFALTNYSAFESFIHFSIWQFVTSYVNPGLVVKHAQLISCNIEHSINIGIQVSHAV